MKAAIFIKSLYLKLTEELLKLNILHKKIVTGILRGHNDTSKYILLRVIQRKVQMYLNYHRCR